MTLFPLMKVYKIMKQNIPSISEAFQLLISKKMVEDICTESNKKARDACSSSMKSRKKTGTQRIVCIYRDFDSSRGEKKKIAEKDYITQYVET